jgi:hypothetical protein
MNAAYISAIAALCGSVIGALASFATTWLTQHHQDERRRHSQENARRERIFGEFIDLSSKAFVDALLQTSIEDPARLIPLYATIGKLRLFASDRTIETAEKVVSQIIETHYQPKFDLQTKPALGPKFDILHEFTKSCRAELRKHGN